MAHGIGQGRIGAHAAQETEFDIEKPLAGGVQPLERGFGFGRVGRLIDQDVEVVNAVLGAQHLDNGVRVGQRGGFRRHHQHAHVAHGKGQGPGHVAVVVDRQGRPVEVAQGRQGADPEAGPGGPARALGPHGGHDQSGRQQQNQDGQPVNRIGKAEPRSQHRQNTCYCHEEEGLRRPRGPIPPGLPE